MSRLRDESGFTLTELLVTMGLGIIVLFTTLQLLDSGTRLSAKTADRVETNARARTAMDLITRQLRSQVCLGAGEPALVAAEPNAMTFYASLAGASANVPIQKRSLTYDPAARTITERVWNGTGTRPSVTFPPAAAPTTTRVLATNVVGLPGVPIFRYSRFGVPVGGGVARPTVITTPPPLPLEDRERTVLYEVSFAALGRVRETRIELTSAVYSRTSNPAKPELSPTCL